MCTGRALHGGIEQSVQLRHNKHSISDGKKRHKQEEAWLLAVQLKSK